MYYVLINVMCSLYSFFLIVSIFLHVQVHSYESLCMCLLCFTKIKTKGLYSKWNSMNMHIKVLILSPMFNWSYLPTFTFSPYSIHWNLSVMMCFNFKLLRPTTTNPYFKFPNTWIRLQEVIQSTMNVICQICIYYATNISDFYRLQAYWNKHHSSMGAQRESCENHLQCVCKQGRIHGGAPGAPTTPTP